MNKFPHKVRVSSGAYSGKLNHTNDAKNIRIVETPKAIRNNQFSHYTGKFSISPTVSNVGLNNQKIRTVYSSHKNIYSFGTDNSKISN